MRTLVVAEDDPDDRHLIQDAIRACGIAHPVVFLSDGEELIAYLRRTGAYASLAGTSLPGLVLLDLNMPRKDGREALTEIKSDAGLRSVPVVVMSSACSPDQVATTYGDGANSFVEKPGTFEHLVALMRSLDRYWLQTVALPSIRPD